MFIPELTVYQEVAREVIDKTLAKTNEVIVISHRICLENSCNLFCKANIRTLWTKVKMVL
jgi:hypothetical protein